jgi:hypothetical protein
MFLLLNNISVRGGRVSKTTNLDKRPMQCEIFPLPNRPFSIQKLLSDSFTVFVPMHLIFRLLFLQYTHGYAYGAGGFSSLEMRPNSVLTSKINVLVPSEVVMHDVILKGLWNTAITIVPN